jgi:aminocarboxymuconate-semialdehyde decarboxylase
VAQTRIRLDIHAHLIPWARGARVGINADIAGVEWSAKGFLRLDGNELPLEKLYDPQALIDWMDANRVERAWVSVPPTLYRLALGPDAAREWAAVVNATLGATSARFPERLAPLLHLPMQHPAIAAEIARAAIAAGQARFAMPAGSATHGLMLSEPAYDPLWAVLDEARAFLFLHPSRGCDPRLDRFYLQNLFGNPTETAIAAAHLAMSGILERHPGITFCLAHGGGTAGAVAGRLERGQATGRPGADTGAEKVRRAFRRFCVDCITHDRAALEYAAAVHGADRVLFGSDWPYAMGLPEPHAQLAGADPRLLQAIFVDNPERLLREGGLPVRSS